MKAAGPKEGAVRNLRERGTPAKEAKKTIAENVHRDATADASASDKSTDPKESGKQTENDMRTSNATKTNATKATKAKPAKADRRKKTKAKASSNARKPVSDAPKTPSGKAETVGKLASRPNGASRDELIKATGWKQQAWKWYFHNSKKTGFCQRFGYNLEVLEGKDGETRYKIVKRK